MMHRAKKPPKTYSFTCDGCSTGYFETDHYVHARAMQEFRDRQWSSIQVKGEWRHYCRSCSRRLGID